MKDLPFQVRETGEASGQKPRSILSLGMEFAASGVSAKRASQEVVIAAINQL
jgi:hypothetical protein